MMAYFGERCVRGTSIAGMSVLSLSRGAPGIGPTLLDAGGLRNLLGIRNPQAGAKKGGGNAPSSSSGNIDLMIHAILEESGLMGLKKKSPRKKKKRKLHVEKPEVINDPLERARAQRNARNNIHEFASAMGIPGDDVNYLERQFLQVKKIIGSSADKLRAAYLQLLGSETNTFTANDAYLLLLFVGIEIDEAVLSEICDHAEIGCGDGEEKGQQNQEQDDRALDFAAWLTGVLAWLRHYLMAGVLAERRGEIQNQFLDSMAQTTSVTLSALPVVAPPPPSLGLGPHAAQDPFPPVISSLSTFPGLDAESSLFDDSMIEKMHRQAAARRVSRGGDVGLSSTVGPGLSMMHSSILHQGSSASVMSQITRGSLPPIKIKQMQKLDKDKKKRLMVSAGFNASMTRSTPRCLRDDLVAGDRTIDMLRRELQLAQEGLMHLNTMVDTNIAWVHSNCDMTAVNGGIISTRTREKCQKMAVERLFLVLQGYLLTSTHWSFLRWRRACQFDKVSELARHISRLKSIEIVTAVLYEAISRQFLRGWAPWKKGLQTQQRWEQEAAVCEISRIVRGFTGRRRAKRVRRHKASVHIQCMFRKYKARRRVRMRRSYLRIFRAAKRLQWFFKCIMLRKRAKKEAARRRKLKAVKKIQAVQRGNVARTKVELAEEKKRKVEADRQKELDDAMAEEKRGKFKGKSPPKARSPSPDKKDKKADKKTHLTGAANKQVAAQKAKLREDEERKKAVEAEERHRRAERMRKEDEHLAEEAAIKAKMQAEAAAEKEAHAARENEEQVKEAEAKSPSFLGRGLNVLGSVMGSKKALSPLPEEKVDNFRCNISRRSFDNSISSLGSIATGEGEYFIPIQNDDGTPPMRNSPKPGKSPEDLEKDRLAVEEKERKRLEKEEKGRVAADEKARIAAEVAEKKRLEKEEKDRLAAEAAEKKRLEKEEKNRLAAEEKEKKRLEKEEKGRIAAEEKEALRLEKEELERAANESAAETAERKRLEKIEKDRLAAEEKVRLAAEAAEKKRLEKEEKDRLAAEEKERKRIEKEKMDKLAAEEKERKRLEKEEADRAAAEEKEKKKREKEAADRMLAAEKANLSEDKAKIAAEEKERKDRLAAEEKEKKSKLAAEAAEKKRLDKEEKDRIAAEEKERKRLEKEEKDRLAAEEKERKRIEKEALAASKPQTPGFIGSLFSRPSTASAEAGSLPKTPAKDATAATEPAKPSTASKLGGMFSTGLSTLLSSASKAIAPSPEEKKKKKKKKGPSGPPPTSDEAVLKMQLFARVWKAHRRIKAKRDSMMKEQKRLGQLILWATVLIQSVARMRRGRIRFNNFWVIYQKNLSIKKLACTIKIQSLTRGRRDRLRVRALWIEHAEKIKADEWKEYQKEQNRRAKQKAKEMEELDRLSGKKSGRKSPELVDEDAPMPLYGGIDVEQVREIDEKIQRMEQLERRIAEKEKTMQEAALRAEERQLALEKTLKAMEERARADEAQRAIEKELLAMAAGPINSYRGGNSARGPGGYSARGPPGSARPGGGAPFSARLSARDQPPSARSARGGAGIPPDAPKITHEGTVWVQLWDPDERHNYWYCEATQAAQWDEPGKPPVDYESGYESTGGMTDYSTDHYTSGGSVSGSEWGDDDAEWQEFWDEQAQAKYWFNASSGEASWTKPQTSHNASMSSMSTVPEGARTSAGAMDWVSYLDEETGQEYW